MSDQPTEERAIALRTPSSMDRVQYLRTRLQANDARLRTALQELNRAAHDLTPAAAVSRQPVQYVLGAFALGLIVGFMTRSHSNGG
jgi:hypothetical protein